MFLHQRELRQHHKTCNQHGLLSRPFHANASVSVYQLDRFLHQHSTFQNSSPNSHFAQQLSSLYPKHQYQQIYSLLYHINTIPTSINISNPIITPR